jgi:hypothetical protein
LAARIGAFEAALSYAKITPAALHRGEAPGRRREGAEAAAGNSKFGLSENPAIATGAPPPAPRPPGMAAS